MSKYAVVQVGAHQYQVEENGTFEVEKLTSLFEGDVQGKEVKLGQVLFVRENGKAKVGQPYVQNAAVVCEVVTSVKLPKVVSFKFKRRKGYKLKKGHRQTVVRLKVRSIQAG